MGEAFIQPNQTINYVFEGTSVLRIGSSNEVVPSVRYYSNGSSGTVNICTFPFSITRFKVISSTKYTKPRGKPESASNIFSPGIYQAGASESFNLHLYDPDTYVDSCAIVFTVSSSGVYYTYQCENGGTRYYGDIRFDFNFTLVKDF